MGSMSLTFRFRGEFRELAGRDSIIVEIPGPGPISLDAAITYLLSVVLAGGSRGSGDHSHGSDGIKTAAFFCDGSLLRLEDQIPDGCTIHILSPLAGG